MTEIPAPDLAAVLEFLASKATQGPWRLGNPCFRCVMAHEHTGGANCIYPFDGWTDDQHWAKYIYRDKEMMTNKDAECVAGMVDYDEGGIQKAEDAELIVALRNNLPAILAALRR